MASASEEWYTSTFEEVRSGLSELRYVHVPSSLRAGFGREAHIGRKLKELGRERMRLRGVTANSLTAV